MITPSPRLSPVRQPARDDDRVLRQGRLAQFFRWMIPIAIGFIVIYAVGAEELHSTALLGVTLDVFAFLVALLFARSRLRKGALADASEIVTTSLCLMCVFGAPLVPWLRSPLLLIPVAGVALVLPDIEGVRLRRVLLLAFLSEMLIISIATWFPAPLVPPPAVFRQSLLVAATIFAVGLTFLLLFQDAQRLRKSIATADFNALQVQAAVDRAPIVIFAVDIEGRYTLSEGQGLARFGLAKGERVGQSAFEVHAAHEWYTNAILRAIRGEECSATGELGDAVVEVHVSPMEPSGAIGVAIDVTERHRAEEALQASIRLRDDFLSIASHELRTPLTPLRLEVGALQRAADRGDLSAIGTRSGKLLHHITRLTNLVDELLDVARIRAGRLTLMREPTNLGEVTDAVLGRLAQSIDRSGCRVEVKREGDLVGDWDSSRVDQIVTNLVTNAVKYGAGTPIDIHLDGDENEVRLSVRDQGIGISESDKQRIFSRFERAVSERSYGGLGLGLFIVREIVEAHGGTITVESTLGAGSTFRLVLPRRPPLQS